MKSKKVKIIIITLISLLIIFTAGWVVTVEIVGEKTFDIILDSISEEDIAMLEEAAGMAVEDSADISEENNGSKNNEEFSDEGKSDNANKNNPESKEKNEKNEKNGKNEKKEISFSDKQKALQMAYSHFSMSEINEGLDKMKKGFTKEDVTYYKKLLKSRLSKDEIKQLKEWYKEYK